MLIVFQKFVGPRSPVRCPKPPAGPVKYTDTYLLTTDISLYRQGGHFYTVPSIE